MRYEYAIQMREFGGRWVIEDGDWTNRRHAEKALLYALTGWGADRALRIVRRPIGPWEPVK